jgi:hypothetical protein
MAKDESARRELGISRRELLRKGAIVGGTLLWATPVVQSLTPAAQAAASPICSCCACNQPVFPGGSRCVVDGFSAAGCAAACGAGGVNSFCESTTGVCSCTSTPTVEPLCTCTP